MSTAAANAIPPVPGAPVYRRDQSVQCKKLIVGVHGMGDQMRNAFIQDIARLFARYRPSPTQATRLPLALWDAGGDDPDEDHAIAFVSVERTRWLQPYAFAEMHWAHLPRKLEDQGHRLEDPIAWAGSIVERLTQRHDLRAEFHETGPRIAATVVEEIGETIRLLQRLLVVFKLAGIFDFEIGRIVERSLCDVQQVADLQGQRWNFLRYFFARMEFLARKCPLAEIHLIAHSEGSALAFYALLTALRHQTEPRGLDLSWIERVRSFSTLGSPIDKHLILFPEMWFHFSENTTWRRFDTKIRWRNYCDCADPVGFNLNTTRLQLRAWRCPAFEFEDEHDFVFRRYLLPGQAHGDYFNDDKLFAHLIESAIECSTPLPPKPADTIAGRISPAIPFLVVAGVHVAAVTLLKAAVVGNLDGLPGDWLGILSGAGLLLGTTVLARTLRLTGRAWVVTKAATFYAAMAGCFALQTTSHAAWYFVSASLGSVIAALLIDHWAVRHRRRPIGGLRALITLGAVAAFVWLAVSKYHAVSTDGRMIFTFAGAAAFFYLWWLGALLYDLAYCWARYINSEHDLLSRIRPLVRPARDEKAACEQTPASYLPGGQEFERKQPAVTRPVQ